MSITEMDFTKAEFDRMSLQFDDNTIEAKLVFWLLPAAQQPLALDNPQFCAHGGRRFFNTDVGGARYGDVYAYLDVRLVQFLGSRLTGCLSVSIASLRTGLRIPLRPGASSVRHSTTSPTRSAPLCAQPWPSSASSSKLRDSLFGTKSSSFFINLLEWRSRSVR